MRPAIAIAAVLAAGTPLVAATPGTGILALYYQGSLPYLKYNPGTGWISPCPGSACAPFSPSTNTSYPASQGWQYIEVAGNQVTWVELTANGGQYDHCQGGSNCVVSLPGIYTQQNGVVTAIQTYPSGCPTNCVAPRGSCVQPGDVCVCSPGYLGVDCTETCPTGSNGQPCSGHGSCSSSQPTCECDAGWASCGTGAGDACGTSVSNDPDNCGACGSVCKADPSAGIASATCANSTCTVTCASGYISCSPGTCTPGNDPSVCPIPPLPGCQTYDDNQCSGANITTPASYIARMWQAPAPGQEGYVPAYQQHYRLQGYARIVYTDVTRTAGNVSVVTFQRDPSVTLTFSFDGGKTYVPQTSAVFCSPSYTGSVPCDFKTSAASVNVTAQGSDGSTLAMDPLWFMWAAPSLGPVESGKDDRGGQKGGIIELFGWPHKDIEAECADIAAAGWLGIKIWNPAETVASWEPFNGALNPWFFEYQPMSYRLESRLGTMDALRSMVATCRAAGVRIYFDSVTNHMVGAGNDALPQHRSGSGSSCTYWPAKTTSAAFWNSTWAGGEGGSACFSATQDYQFQPNNYTRLPPSQEFPAVPYNPTHFHCERVLSSWTDPVDLNAGWLEGLVDLNTEDPYVRQRIADYWTNMLSFGFSGFRVDAAKHVHPDDHVAILSIMRDNLGGQLPGDFHLWQEVLTGGEGDMLVCTNSSGYNYGGYIESALLGAGFTESEMLSVRLWADYYPKQPSLDCGNVDMRRKAIQNDDADQQTTGSTSRDMGNAGCVLTVNCPDDNTHRSFEVELYTNPPGSSDPDNDYPIRMLLSSFWFDTAAQAYGIPDGFSDCSLCQENCETCASSMPYTPAHVPDAPSYTPKANGAYTRTHRDLSIINAMRAWVHLPPLSGEAAARFQ